jgi:CHAD domain-containing protein
VTSLAKRLSGPENRRYRDAGRLLSGSRDAEVKLETLSALRERFDHLPKDTGERWQGMLETERDELAAAMRGGAEGRISRAVEAIETGRDAIGQWRLQTDAWALLEPGLLGGYENGRKAMERALAGSSTENVHEWRKRAKDLWYQLRIVHDAWPELLGETVSQAHQLTDLLGDHHDLAVLAEDLGTRDDLGERGAFETAIETRQAELLEAALGIGARLYAEKPKAFRRRIKRYWLAWREA